MNRKPFPHQMNEYHGKVRDVYYIDNQLLVMIASDRISAFDVILPSPIPLEPSFTTKARIASCGSIIRDFDRFRCRNDKRSPSAFSKTKK
jgi:phosphoribosylaminoimidazole-succinocarboxamide synthase